MTTRIWTKKETQNTIKQLRKSGFNVVKIDYGYQIMNDLGEVWIKDKQPLFKAMMGAHGYLIRYHTDLME
tara:strand:- start:90 stop:299 length:210 start_codon:yes stop_codon:yes gene_type:complete